MDKAEAADNAPDDGTRLPEALSRRKTLKAKLDEAAKRLQEEAGEAHDDERAPPAVKADKPINLALIHGWRRPVMPGRLRSRGAPNAILNR